ncbi:hypothetical protein KAB67_000745 [Salmonella enterica]|nr:hypothetical protein DOE63_16595 [Salmonella enterica subsp. diarizonae serovar 59:z10:-]EHJ0335995.1 hypothetical protein [Salmonella enterica]
MYEPCNELTSLVEVYQRWLNDQTRLAVRYGFSTRKAHGWHTLTTSGITLADGRQLSECVRLQLAGVYHCLERVFSRLKAPGLRESLTLLCWYEMVAVQRLAVPSGIKL